jgi:osmotically-inducible protein OsmY
MVLYLMTKLFDQSIVAIVVAAGCSGVLAAPVAARAAQPPATQSSTTPLKTRTDGEITQLIKQALQREKSLSADARKVQVVTLAGYVTLKGRVRSAEERAVVEAKAAQIAGDDYVMSQLTVPKSVGKTRAPAAR